MGRCERCSRQVHYPERHARRRQRRVPNQCIAVALGATSSAVDDSALGFSRNGIRVRSSSSFPQRTSNQYNPYFGAAIPKSILMFAPCSPPLKVIGNWRRGLAFPSGGTSRIPTSKSPTTSPDLREIMAVNATPVPAGSCSDGISSVYVSTMRIRLKTPSGSTSAFSQMQATCTHGLGPSWVIASSPIVLRLPFSRWRVAWQATAQPLSHDRPWTRPAWTRPRRQGCAYLASPRASPLGPLPLGRSAMPTDWCHAHAFSSCCDCRILARAC
jgi:hypothetical protein